MHYYVPSDEKISQINDLIAMLKKQYAKYILSIELINNELVCVANKEDFIIFIDNLKDNSHCMFKQLIDITAVDYPQRVERFEIVYHFLSLVHNVRLRIKINIKENEPIESLSSLYTNANWLERELWDMFGIYVVEHHDLRRILTDFGFSGHPLRKDFPLTGFSEVFYNNETSKVEYKDVELMQAFRDYSYKNPWMDDIHSDTFKAVNRNKNTSKDN